MSDLNILLFQLYKINLTC